MNLVYFVLSCPQDQFDNNGVCQTSCTPLFISADQKYCVPSCSPSQFQIIDLETYCKEKCANNFLWSDSTTCTPTCSQLGQFIAPTGFYCVDNCPPSSKIYSNSTDKYCLNSCPPDAPFSHKINDNYVCASNCDEFFPGSIPNAQNDCVFSEESNTFLDQTELSSESEVKNRLITKFKLFIREFIEQSREDMIRFTKSVKKVVKVWLVLIVPIIIRKIFVQIRDKKHSVRNSNNEHENGNDENEEELQIQEAFEQALEEMQPNEIMSSQKFKRKG
ncbi:Hypothetical_protein [Hexamita inflata]|uniref:Hypothetical_protein n=1 Tax=Hexamita inflata TaxID=28002 RepID=A0AA86PJQ3_9EUKA|nr:Hypothetical protein HINF_LOCUS27311 [Hexamita inflata]